jgi:uncharacterized protein (DUF2267 family)
MRYVEFIRRVEDRVAGGLGPERGEQATRAVLTALAASLPRERAEQLATQLPVELQRMLHANTGADSPTSADEFLDLVSDREELSRSEALDHTRAVVSVLGEAVTARVMRHVRSDLPDDFDTLLRPPAATKWPETHTPHHGH